MIKVYIAPHNVKRYNDGVMYELAQMIQNELKSSSVVDVTVPAQRAVCRCKYDNIRDARKTDCKLFVCLQEGNITSDTPTMGIYCSEINQMSIDAAYALDEALEGILPFECHHVKVNETDNAIHQFEYTIPSVVFYVNYNREDGKQIVSTIREKKQYMAKAFAEMINFIAEVMEAEEYVEEPEYQKGDMLELSIEDGAKLRAFVSLEGAIQNGYNEYYLHSGTYVVYDFKNDCINVSNSADIPGVWIRKEDISGEE